jgi:hypothetical protein
MTLVGQEPMAGAPPTRALAIPMMLLCVIAELRKYNDDHSAYLEQATECTRLIRLHIKPKEKIVLETVGLNGLSDPLKSPSK